jgi:hypothetical protein
MSTKIIKNGLYNKTWKGLRAEKLERFGTPALKQVPPLNAVESWARKTPTRRVRFSVGAWSYDLPASEAVNLIPTIVYAIAYQMSQSEA